MQLIAAAKRQFVIRSIISFCVYKPFIALLFGAFVAAAGVYSFNKLPIDAVPDITNVQVQVNTQVGNLPPEEIERAVTNAESAKPQAPTEMYDYLYKDRTEELDEQREQSKRDINK